MATKQSINQLKYDKANTTSIHLKFNNKTDPDIIDKLDQVESKQGYIKELIRQDIARTCPGKNIVSVPVSDTALSIIKEHAEKSGLSVPDLLSVMITEQLIRT